ncbi:MAG: hypothetical protein IKM44_04570, partial [Clostridia bacterium]|nr:hypothetical protein [Clostridia bacterium]
IVTPFECFYKRRPQNFGNELSCLCFYPLLVRFVLATEESVYRKFYTSFNRFSLSKASEHDKLDLEHITNRYKNLLKMGV